MADVLLTAFAPFRDYAINSSWEAARRVSQLLPQIQVECLPVEHVAAATRLRELLLVHTPRICLCTGLAEGDDYRIELHARQPAELSGWAHADLAQTTVLPGAWPWPEMRNALGAQGARVRLSEDAGRYVCESTYWSLLAFRREFGAPAWAGFLHVPPLSAQHSADSIGGAVHAVLTSRLAALSL